MFPFLLFVDCEVEKVDLVFLVDGSTSIHEKDFEKMKTFLSSVVQDFDVSVDRVRIGVAQFSHIYQPEFPLGKFIGKQEISLQIEKIKQLFGNTHIGAALRQVKSYFRPDTGSRINAGTPQVLLVLTDGKSQDDVAQDAEDLRNKGIDIYSVGIGEVDDQQLIQITGDANKKLTVHNFDELRKIKKRIVRNICTQGGDSSKYSNMSFVFLPPLSSLTFSSRSMYASWGWWENLDRYLWISHRTSHSYQVFLCDLWLEKQGT